MTILYALSLLLVILAFCLSVGAYSSIGSLSRASRTISAKFSSPPENSSPQAEDELGPPMAMKEMSEMEQSRAPVVKTFQKAERTVLEMTPAQVELMVATAVGGAILGTTVGALIDLNLLDSELPLYIAPLVLGSLFGGGSYYATSEPQVAPYANKYLGQPTLAARDKLVTKVQESASNANKAINKKIDDTIEDITSIPRKTKSAILKKVEDIVSAIKALPGNLQKATQKKVDEIASSIEAAPGQAVKSINKSVEATKLAAQRKTEVCVIRT